MNLLTKIRALDYVTKIGCIILVTIMFYIILLFILKPVFIEETIGTHTTVMGDHLMTFTSPAQRNLNLLALFLAIGSGLATWLIIKEQQNNKEDVSKQELEIVKKALSTDEKKMVEEVQKAGEITQDSLRFRLDKAFFIISSSCLDPSSLLFCCSLMINQVANPLPIAKKRARKLRFLCAGLVNVMR